MTERHLTILQINDLHGYLEPHPEAFRGRGKFNYRTCGGLARIASIFKRVRARLQSFAGFAAYAGAPTTSAGSPRLQRSLSGHGAAMRSPFIDPGGTP